MHRPAPHSMLCRRSMRAMDCDAAWPVCQAVAVVVADPCGAPWFRLMEEAERIGMMVDIVDDDAEAADDDKDDEGTVHVRRPPSPRTAALKTDASPHRCLLSQNTVLSGCLPCVCTGAGATPPEGSADLLYRRVQPPAVRQGLLLDPQPRVAGRHLRPEAARVERPRRARPGLCTPSPPPLRLSASM